MGLLNITVGFVKKNITVGETQIQRERDRGREREQ